MVTHIPNPEDSSPVETRGNAFALLVWKSLTGEGLKPEIEAVERYFGGSSYSADPATRERIDDAIHQACRIVSPLMTFSIKPIQSMNLDGTITLSGGVTLPFPGCACRLTARFLVAAIGTLGKDLETECLLLASKQRIYQSTLLDAVGTAMLEALDARICVMVDAECHLRGLLSGVRFAPGLNGYPMERQLTLYQLADGVSVDVRLNDAFLMEPMKTISFFTLMGYENVKNQNPDKCPSCRMPHCQFRKRPSSVPDSGMEPEMQR